jgi:hypothetical protein
MISEYKMWDGFKKRGEFEINNCVIEKIILYKNSFFNQEEKVYDTSIPLDGLPSEVDLDDNIRMRIVDQKSVNMFLKDSF